MARGCKSRNPAQTPATSQATVPPTRAPSINWMKNPEWTDRLVAYLSENPTFRQQLFSDSTSAANKADRRKSVAKDGRAQQFGKLAAAIFAKDNTQKDLYKDNPAWYGMSVDTRLRRLKTDYQGYLKELGKTGAGLDPNHITSDSPMANLIDSFCADWPWWDDLHAFWRELPNYNTIGVSLSQPGTNHAAAAANLYAPAPPAAPSDTDEEEDGNDEEPQPEVSTEHNEKEGEMDFMEPELEGGAFNDGDDNIKSMSSPARSRSTSILSSQVATPSSRSSVSAPSQRGSSRVSTGRDLGLAKIVARGKNKEKVIKKGPLDKFHDNRENKTARLSRKHQMAHDQEMARIDVKRLKLEIALIKAKNEAASIGFHVKHVASAQPFRATASHHRELGACGASTTPTFGTPGPSNATASGSKWNRNMSFGPPIAAPVYDRFPAFSPTVGKDDGQFDSFLEMNQPSNKGAMLYQFPDV